MLNKKQITKALHRTGYTQMKVVEVLRIGWVADDEIIADVRCVPVDGYPDFIEDQEDTGTVYIKWEGGLSGHNYTWYADFGGCGIEDWSARNITYMNQKMGGE